MKTSDIKKIFDMVSCLDCEGSGMGINIGTGPQYIDCPTCNGEGFLTPNKEYYTKRFDQLDKQIITIQTELSKLIKEKQKIFHKLKDETE